MQMLDNYEGSSIIVAATNHQHLLDKAVWRRFDDIIYFDLPDNSRRKQLFEKYLRGIAKRKQFHRGPTCPKNAQILRRFVKRH